MKGLMRLALFASFAVTSALAQLCRTKQRWMQPLV